MEITEKAAYVKGLIDGLELDPKDKQTKIFKIMIDLINDMAEEIKELEQCYDDVSDKIDGIDEELSGIENVLYDEDDDEGFCGNSVASGSDSDVLYECTCPTCQKTVGISENSLSEGGIECPYCGESLEFDYDEDELDDIPEETSEE